MKHNSIFGHGAPAFIGLLAALCLSGPFLQPMGLLAGPEPAGQGQEVWTCSMHPQVRLPNPGKCPICSMPLIRAAMPGSPGRESAPVLELSEHARAMAGVETALVQRRKMSHEIRAFGKVQYNETGLANVTSRVDGYAEKLFVDFTGARVGLGDHLVEVYSPDLVVAQQELLLALAGPRQSTLLDSSTKKLLRWGLTQAQVDSLVRDGKIHERLPILSPIEGTVVERMVVQKGAVRAGETLYRLANLESVWVYVDIYESELPGVQYGQEVELRAQAVPGREFRGRVWLISPVLDEDTRTVKVLVNIDNSGQQLKPGMFVNAIIRSNLLANGQVAPTGSEGRWSCPMHPFVLQPKPGACPACQMALVQIPGKPASATREEDRLVLSIPVTAVLDSGLRKVVFVEKARGEYAPVEVTTGPRSGDSYPVLKGLREGDRVVVRGSFLLDSQLQIQGLPSLFNKEVPSGAGGHQHHGTSPPKGASTSSPEPPMPAKGHQHGP